MYTHGIVALSYFMKQHEQSSMKQIFRKDNIEEKQDDMNLVK